MASFVYRSVVLGLLGALALLAATRGQPPPTPPAAARDAIVDVSRQAAGDRVLALLGLGPGERVTAIGDAPATLEDVPAAWRALASGSYLDLTVAGPGGAARRVLVLAHR
ncbi:MAG: hypothetical protein R3B06_27195 [Kofleriaceae bacterium]